MPYQRSGERTAIDARQGADDSRREQLCMGHVDEVLSHPPDLAGADHPAWMSPIKAREVYRPREGAECPVATKVYVPLEVAHSQLAEAPVHGLAIADSGKVRL